MKRDPFYMAIEEGLSRELDPEIFERAAVALLRGAYSRLAPMRGGNDDGMDGAIADLDGATFPLTCTVSPDVIGNLTRSLNSYKEGRGVGGKVVCATSQSLTPVRKRNLAKRAKRLGFELVNVHDRPAFADLLYQNPNWTRELLGLTGQPSALSALPSVDRPMQDATLVGRSKEKNWLEESQGDCLVIGEPGVGKTFLIRQMADTGWLFLRESDDTAIANAIREQNPKAIVIDDEHDQGKMVRLLKNLRQSISAEFSIVVTSWPGEHADILQKILGTPDRSRLVLDRLDRDSIAEILRSAGIVNNNLVREIVDQAEGRPGLAITLANLCLAGDVMSVVRGKSLRQDIDFELRRFVDDAGMDLLGILALSGSSGASVADAARALQISVTDVSRGVKRLAHGGVIEETGWGQQKKLRVQPELLRNAIVSDKFFGGVGSLSWFDFRDAFSVKQLAESLLGARRVGGSVSDYDLIQVLEEASESHLWRKFAELGPDQCSRVLRERPEYAMQIAPSALYLVPNDILPVLLDASLSDKTNVQSNPDHPIRLIESWSQDPRDGLHTTIERRGILADSMNKWGELASNPEVTGKLVAIVCSPVVEFGEVDPGGGARYTWSRGVFNAEELKVLRDLWNEIVNNRYLKLDSMASELLSFVNDWLAAPSNCEVHLDDDSLDTLKAIAVEMLSKLLLACPDNHGLRLEIDRIGRRNGLQLEVEVKADFRILFDQPSDADSEDWKAYDERMLARIEEIAERLSQRDMKEVVAQLEGCKDSARAARPNGPDRTSLVYQSIAEKIECPESLVAAMIELGVDHSTLLVVLEGALAKGNPKCKEIATTLLDNAELKWVSMAAICACSPEHDELLNFGLKRACEDHSLLERACRIRTPSRATLFAALETRDSFVAGEVAVAWWVRYPEALSGLEIEKWRDAIVNYNGNNEWLQYLLKENPEIAGEWVVRQCSDGRRLQIFDQQGWKETLDVLGSEERIVILNNIVGQEDIKFYFEFSSIVGQDPDVFVEVLTNSELLPYARYALVGPYSEKWRALAILALEHGVSDEEIVSGFFSAPLSWVGSESAHWKQWIVQVEEMQADLDFRIVKIGDRLRKIIEGSIQQAEVKEHRESIYGRNR